MLATIALILGQTQPSDPRNELIEALFKRDFALFYKDVDAFGASRIEMPLQVGGDHTLMGRSIKPSLHVERFLVGNKTERFNAQAMRTTYVPVFKGREAEPRKPEFSQKDVELEVRRSFGTDFKWWTKGDAWLVRGFPINARKACLSCHGWAKTGQPLGYLVYAVRN